jgi:hypothetical protein
MAKSALSLPKRLGAVGTFARIHINKIMGKTSSGQAAGNKAEVPNSQNQKKITKLCQTI